jgi:hypothetical protein
MSMIRCFPPESVALPAFVLKSSRYGEYNPREIGVSPDLPSFLSRCNLHIQRGGEVARAVLR